MKNKLNYIWMLFSVIIIALISALFLFKHEIITLCLFLVLEFCLYLICFKKGKKQAKTFWVITILFSLLISITSFCNIIPIIIVGVILYLFSKKEIKNFPLYLLIFSFIIRLLTILFIDVIPVSDFKTLLLASQNILDGDYLFNNTSYFYNWAYQIGFVFVQSLFLRIVNSVLFLKIVNCIITSLICIVIYLISKEFSNKKCAQSISFLYSIFIFPLTFTQVLTNQHLSALLIYFGLYILIKKNTILKEYYRYILSGVLISLGNIIRPEGIITIFSVFLFCLLTLNKKNLKKQISNFMLLILSYVLIFNIFSFGLKISGIAPNGLTNNAPQWKFVLGFNFDTNGSYSDDDEWTITDKKAGYNLVINRIKDNITNIPKLFIKKSIIFWTDNSLNWGIPVDENNNYIELYNFNNSYFFVILLLAIIGIINVFKFRENKNILLITNQITITFMVYLLIEVQSRYVYFAQISIFILASIGVKALLNNKMYLNDAKNDV